MPCSRCGSGAAPLHGRCAQCGASVGSDSIPTAIGLATPLPIPNSDDSTTQFGMPNSDDNATQFGFGGTTSMPPPGSPPGPPTPVPPVATTTTMPQTLGLTVGQNFGSRYHIIRLLGVGGMGAVYQAWDQTLEVAVAIKVIRPRDGAGRASRGGARAALQARAAARAPGHAQERRPHPRPRRDRRHHVHHDAVRAGIRPRARS